MNNTQKLVRTAAIAAIYAAVSLVLAPISYGTVQVRISEALTLLPMFSPFGIVGVTLGCFITNLIGMFTGANILGGLDVLFGTSATFLAALLTYALRKKSVWLAALPPVIINAVVIGLELAFVIEGNFAAVFALQALSVGAGQLIACYLLGVPLVKLLQKNNSLRNKIFDK